MPTYSVNDFDKAYEMCPRRAARHQGRSLRKSRCSLSIDNLGGYMLIRNFSNAIVAGSRFDLTLEAVEEYIAEG